MHHVLRFPRVPESVTEARRATRQALAGHADKDNVGVVALLVTELVTNSVNYSRGAEVLLIIDVTDRRVRVDVRDGGPPFLVPDHVDGLQENGRGLDIVARLASDWGRNHSSGSNDVWFVIAEPA